MTQKILVISNNAFRNNKILTFFDNFSKEQYEKKISNKLSVSLIPLPKFRGTVKEFFNKIHYKIQTKIFKNCEHRIPTEGSSIGLEFLKKNLYK